VPSIKPEPRSTLETRPSGEEDAPAFRGLGHLFTGTDARIAATIEHGFQDRLYFVSITYPRIDERERPGAILRPRQRWVPVASAAHNDLLPIVRGRLRPPPAPSVVPEESIAGRQAYEKTLAQQPGIRSLSGRPR
jgi:hypothetical protein